MTKLKLSGGDIVRLSSGKIVTIADIKLNHIVVASDEWYPLSDVAEIIRRHDDMKR